MVLQILDSLVLLDGVIGCGEYNGSIQVFLDEDENIPATTKRIKDIVGPYELYSEEVSRTLKRLFYPGAEVVAQNGFGTLGGFFVALRLKQNELYAVTAGHVQRHTDGKINSNGKDWAEFLGSWRDGVDLDIAVAKVYSDFIENCEKRLSDENDIPKRGVIVDRDQERLKPVSKLIYFKGASSGIGVGEVIQFRHKTASNNDAQYLVLKQRNGNASEKPFCEPGDSGSIICCVERRGRFVYVLGTLIGEIQSKSNEYEKKYLALRIHSGVEHLFKKYGIRLHLADSYSE